MINETLAKKQVFKTENNTILIVKVEKRADSDITITADEVIPMLREEAVNRNREYLEEGDLWRDAVEHEMTTLGLDEWVEHVINMDGDISMIDNSLFPQELEIEGEEYIWESGSCGCMHDEILKVMPSSKPFIKGHLRSLHDKANFIYNYEQKNKKKPTKKVVQEHLKETEKILKDSLTAWNKLGHDENWKEKVFSITKEIIKIMKERGE
jgi:hypothetical protein